MIYVSRIIFHSSHLYNNHKSYLWYFSVNGIEYTEMCVLNLMSDKLFAYGKELMFCFGIFNYKYF